MGMATLAAYNLGQGLTFATFTISSFHARHTGGSEYFIRDFRDGSGLKRRCDRRGECYLDR